MPSTSTDTSEWLYLHACCGPCASVAVPDWRRQGFEVRACFFNPNIEPAVEYQRRLDSMYRLAQGLDVPLDVIGEAEAGEESARALEVWRDSWQVQGPADRQGRCRLCIVLRLFETARQAAALDIPQFATTLAISPYQPHDIIREAGTMAAAAFNVEFLYRDQRPLYREHYEQSRRFGLYRQKYCGCALSKWEAWHQRRARKRH